jgi:4'-phosphopantetheinyl transferase
MMIRPWNDLPERPFQPADRCQLWLAWLDEEDPHAWRGLLSEDERLRADRLRNPLSADRFTVARGILRTVLGRTLACKPERLVFSYGSHGKPKLAGGWKGKFSFNVSHSGGLAIFAVAHGFEVGVDIEKIHPISDLEATASIFLLADELADFEALPTGRKLEHFFTLWTCKEAILKASGAGFTSPDKDNLATGLPACLKSEGKYGLFQNKRLTLLDPAQGFKGALACL